MSQANAAELLAEDIVGQASLRPEDFMLTSPAQLPAEYASVATGELEKTKVPREERERWLNTFRELAPTEAWKKILVAHACSQSTLELVMRVGLDPFCELIANGISLRRICKVMGLSYTAMMKYILDDAARSDRYDQSKRISAESFADMAGETLEENTDFDRAKELARHYRWMAERRAPKEFMPKPEPEPKGAVSQSVTFIWNAPSPPVDPGRVIQGN